MAEPDLRDSGQKIGASGLQQRFLGERAGGDQPHHVPRQGTFGAAGLGRRRILHLLDNGNAETAADQPRQIGLGLGDRHAAHLYGLALMLTARGQRDIERRRGRLRIREEQLVEIAHAEEQQRVLMVCLDGKPLRHRGGSTCRVTWIHRPH